MAQGKGKTEFKVARRSTAPKVSKRKKTREKLRTKELSCILNLTIRTERKRNQRRKSKAVEMGSTMSTPDGGSERVTKEMSQI